MNHFPDRPARHRITALLWRLTALILLGLIIFGEPIGLLPKFIAFFAVLIIAVLHDLVAATLQARTIFAVPESPFVSAMMERFHEGQTRQEGRGQRGG